MQRSRLRNIINKANELLNLSRDPYDLFIKSLPSELDYYKDGDKYRLKAAWESYDKPKDLYEARWNGLVEYYNGKFIMPSIGYNQEKDRYEYLNTGQDNDIVNKDIRAWDNNVIPFIQELKQGGYIRQFDEEENCWVYRKGGKTKEYSHWKKSENWAEDKIPYEEWIKDLNPLEYSGNYDLKSAYENLPKEDLERWKFAVTQKDKNAYNYYMDYQDSNGRNIYHLRSIVETPDGNFKFLKLGNELTNPELHYETDGYWNGLNGLKETHNLVFNPEENRYYYIKKGTQLYKNGGQMNVIPEGALHAHKNHMEGAGKDFTEKGIPVVDNDGNQTAEIEREELTVTKEVTDKLENWHKKFYSDELSLREKDEIAIKCGKFITKEILFNTDDRVGLIQKINENGSEETK